MCKAIDDMKASARDEGIKLGIKQGIELGTLTTLYKLVSAGQITLEFACNSVSMNPEDFLAAVVKYTN